VRGNFQQRAKTESNRVVQEFHCNEIYWIGQDSVKFGEIRIWPNFEL